MRLLLKQVTIADPRSIHNGQTADILIERGKIQQIGTIEAADGADVVDVAGLHASPGWVDLFAHFCDPGLEYKETLETGAAAAAAGGYTRVMVMPNTQPCIHAKTQVEYVVQKSKQLAVQVLPIGAISKNCEGKDLAEMYDMHASGAVAFSDATHPLQSSQVMLKALQYVKAFNGVVIQVPDEQSLTKLGLMHEGIISTQLGLPGKPAIGEYLMVGRDIELVRYTGSKIHFTGVSTAASLDLIRKAKAEGLGVTCSVTPYHLHFTDGDLQQYDTNLKVNPPLRLAEDVAAVKAAVLDGTVDAIASHHQPHEYDSKVCEFEYAKYGMESLESCFAAVKTALPSLSAEKIAQLFSIAPADIFGLPLPFMEAGQTAEISLFLPETSWTFDKKDIKSISSNNAFVGKTLQGKPVGIVSKGQLVLNTEKEIING
jgi:dihydroorotase